MHSKPLSSARMFVEAMLVSLHRRGHRLFIIKTGSVADIVFRLRSGAHGVGASAKPPADAGGAMFQVTRELRFCYGHRLLNYDGKCKHLHGHNGRAVITLEADQLDALGMVVDFSVIKRVVAAWIDANLDHRMIL